MVAQSVESHQILVDMGMDMETGRKIAMVRQWPPLAVIDLRVLSALLESKPWDEPSYYPGVTPSFSLANDRLKLHFANGEAVYQLERGSYQSPKICWARRISATLDGQSVREEGG